METEETEGIDQVSLKTETPVEVLGVDVAIDSTGSV